MTTKSSNFMENECIIIDHPKIFAENRPASVVGVQNPSLCCDFEFACLCKK